MTTLKVAGAIGLGLSLINNVRGEGIVNGIGTTAVDALPPKALHDIIIKPLGEATMKGLDDNVLHPKGQPDSQYNLLRQMLDEDDAGK